MLQKEQAETIKQQLLSQLENSQVEDKEDIKAAISNMSPDQLEEFLRKNKLIKEGKDAQECVFCSIAKNELPSYKIAETKEEVAVLEINPVSIGHLIIIPKIHSEKIPKKAFELAEELSQKISKFLDSKKIEIVASSVFGHEIINLIPVYKDENIHSKRKKASEAELEELQRSFLQVLAEKKPEQKEAKKEIISEKTHWLPKRIP